jgi:hypothetical protein
MLRKTRTVACLAIAAAIVGITGTATTAHADLGVGDPAGLHLYEDSWFEGEHYITIYSTNLHGASDRASSIENNDWSAWVVYDDRNFQDRRYCIRPKEKVNVLGAPQWKFNDKISSVKRLNSYDCAGYPTFY